MIPFNRQWWTALLAAGCLSLPADVAIGQTDEPARRQRQAAAPQGDTGGDEGLDVPLRMRFEVIELTLSPEQIRQINASTEFVDFQELATEGIKSGQAHIKHAFDTTLDVGPEARFVSGARVPLVRRRTSAKSGDTSTEISYESVGCELELRCLWADPGDHSRQTRIDVSWEIQVSEVFRDSSVLLTEGLAAPIYKEVAQEFRTIVPLGTDAWFSSLSSHRANAEGQANARAYVYRARFDWPNDH